MVTIYDNLFFVSYLEVLLEYLNINQLEIISSYCDRTNFNNKMIINIIQTLN